MPKTFELPTFMCGAKANVIRFGNFEGEVTINSSGRETGHMLRYTVHDPTGRLHVYVSGANTDEMSVLFTTTADADAKPLLGLVTVVLNGGVALIEEIKRVIAEGKHSPMPTASSDATIKITITADEDIEVERV